jgi:hypothetical protein
MMGSQMERISVPNCHIAAGLLLKVATLVFPLAARAAEPVPGEERFEAWWTIRTTAQWMQDHGSMRLDGHRDVQLMAALRVAHDALCPIEPQVVYARQCSCASGRLIRDVLDLLETVPTAEALRV